MSVGKGKIDTMIELDKNAEITSFQELAQNLIKTIEEYSNQLAETDEDDSDWDYISGLISAYQTVAGVIGVPVELYYPKGKYE